MKFTSINQRNNFQFRNIQNINLLYNGHMHQMLLTRIVQIAKLQEEIHTSCFGLIFGVCVIDSLTVLASILNCESSILFMSSVMAIDPNLEVITVFMLFAICKTSDCTNGSSSSNFIIWEANRMLCLSLFKKMRKR